MHNSHSTGFIIYTIQYLVVSIPHRIDASPLCNPSTAVWNLVANLVAASALSKPTFPSGPAAANVAVFGATSTALFANETALPPNSAAIFCTTLPAHAGILVI